MSRPAGSPGRSAAACDLLIPEGGAMCGVVNLCILIASLLILTLQGCTPSPDTPPPDTTTGESRLPADFLEERRSALEENDSVLAPRDWDVFDREGRWQWRVLGGAGFDLLQVTDDGLLGVWRGDLGVEEIREYRFVGGSRPPS